MFFNCGRSFTLNYQLGLVENAIVVVLHRNLRRLFAVMRGVKHNLTWVVSASRGEETRKKSVVSELLGSTRRGGGLGVLAAAKLMRSLLVLAQ